VVLQSEKLTGRPKPYAVLLTRTSPMIRARGLTHIQNGLIAAGIPVMETELNERDAFKAVFAFRQTLDGLNPTDVPNLDKAKANVEALAREVLTKLQTHLQGEQGGREREKIETNDVAGAA
jgi:chromosome partitioning protein